MALVRTFLLILAAVAVLIVEESYGLTLPPPIQARTCRQQSMKLVDRRPWSPEKRRRKAFGMQGGHAATPISISGPSISNSDSKDSWEDIMIPTYVGVSETEHDKLTSLDKVVIGGTCIATVFSIYAIFFLTAPGAWRFFCAGGICAATSHAIPTPIDVIKTRKQVDPVLADMNFLQAGHSIVKEEGVNALWAGLGPTALGYLLEGAVKFGTYEILKPVFRRLLASMAKMTSIGFFHSQILSFILCGAAAGFAASIILCPMEAIRIRMVSEPQYATDGWMKVGYKMLKQEGVIGLGKGISPMILKQVPYTVTKNVSFDVLTKALYAMIRAQGMRLTTGSMIAIPLISAGLASILSTITSQPGDMVLSLVNAHRGDRKPSEIFHSILRSSHGIQGFFIGFKSRLLHVGVTVTIQLMVYDFVKRLCGIAATGT